jgi:methionine synthase II (cobalamin-independent)
VTVATGVGSMPGGEPGEEAQNAREYAEAVRVVLGELPDLPAVPELPGRGAVASMTGRTLALVAGLGADLQPAGWRLTDASGVDHRRARSLLSQDLDEVEEQAQGYVGTVKTQVAGPWTLAATVEKPRGDKVLSDHGARRELAQALAEGLTTHVADLRRRLPGADRLVVQVDEPVLPAVLAGRVPTASGFGKHRSVDLPAASASLEWVLDAIAAAGAEPWVHACAPGVPWATVRGAGARGLVVDPAVLRADEVDAVAEALEGGDTVVLGLLPTTEPTPAPAAEQVVERVLRWLDMLGLDAAELGDRLVVAPSCGLAGATAAWSRRALATARTAAAQV